MTQRAEFDSVHRFECLAFSTLQWRCHRQTITEMIFILSMYILFFFGFENNNTTKGLEVARESKVNLPTAFS
jgi:hypothetical protein